MHPPAPSATISWAVLLLSAALASNGPVPVSALFNGNTFESTTAGDVLRRSLTTAGSSPFQSATARTYRRSTDAYAALADAMSLVSVPDLPTASQPLSTGGGLRLDRLSLLRQLRVVAQMIAAAQRMGLRRQVFMVSAGGLDTHASQLRDHPALMGGVAGGIGWFVDAMQSLGLGPNVTLFTASEFGRTLASNASGSDHGWGGHHFVAGGAVRGGDIYGRFPITALNTPDDVGSGRLLPSTSVTEYAATLARWMGVSASDLPLLLPNIGNFSNNNLTFL